MGDGLAWRVVSLITNSLSPSIIRIRQNSSTSFTIFAQYSTYTGGSFYLINIGSATSWVHTNTFSTSAPTGTFIDIIPSSTIGTSDFSASNITTSLIPSNPNSIDLASSSKYWRSAYITNISGTNISITGTVVLPSTTSIGLVTSNQLAFVSGATSNIQTQLTDLSTNKVSSANPSFSGTLTTNIIRNNNTSAVFSKITSTVISNVRYLGDI